MVASSVQERVASQTQSACASTTTRKQQSTAVAHESTTLSCVCVCVFVCRRSGAFSLADVRWALVLEPCFKSVRSEVSALTGLLRVVCGTVKGMSLVSSPPVAVFQACRPQRFPTPEDNACLVLRCIRHQVFHDSWCGNLSSRKAFRRKSRWHEALSFSGYCTKIAMDV